jgi:hypothetical protein
MEMRDRLKEIVKDSLMRHIDKTCSLAGNITNDLLANGVVVPPCKVGDTVFFINTCVTAEDFGKEFISFGRVRKISFDTEIVYFENGRIRWWKEVFLTKEDAEKALREREGNG